MDEFVSRKELLQKAVLAEVDGRLVYVVTCEDIRAAKAANVAPVVRCVDCLYRDGTPGQPNILCFQMHDDDFCSYGDKVDKE